jgi:chromosome segregation ATPase
MSTALLSLVMDFFVLAALGGTIYYTLRLSKSLANFKSSRDELKLLIQELTQNIDEAQRAIEGLKKTSNIAADNLDGVLHESKKMAAEMKFINETSDGLANRLEKLAERNRKVAESMNPAASMIEPDPDYPSYRPARASNVDMPSFFIQDREYGDDEGEGEVWSDDEAAAPLGQFSSQAEKDLYDALQKNKKKSGGGRS